MVSPTIPGPSAEPRSVLGAWTADLPKLAQSFEAASPFPHLVIEDFLQPDLAEELVREFPSLGNMDRSHDYLFGDKRELPGLSSSGTAGAALQETLLSEQFAVLLSQITGRTLFIDPAFRGGGFHQGGDGSYLDTHVDFNVHPDHPDWLRVLNVLVYLNKDWRPDYGGDLLIRSDPTVEPDSIAPLFNRAVVMLTADNTYHGYRKMSLPTGVTRKSIAAYAYERIPHGSQRVRTTLWVPEGAGFLKRTLGRKWPRLVALRGRMRGRR